MAHLQNYVFVHEHNVPAGMLIDGSCQARLPERFLESREPLRRVTGPEGSEKFQVASQRRRYGPNGEEKRAFFAHGMTKDNPEAICVDHVNNCIWVGDDDEPSRIFKIEFENL